MCREARASSYGVEKSLRELAIFVDEVEKNAASNALKKIAYSARYPKGRTYIDGNKRVTEYPSTHQELLPVYAGAAGIAAGSGGVGYGLGSKRSKNIKKSLVELGWVAKGLPSALRGTLTPALRSNPAVRERVGANIMGRASGYLRTAAAETNDSRLGEKAAHKAKMGQMARWSSSRTFPRNGS
jgi:hypothetical protein